MDTVDKATKSKHINTLQYTTVTRIAGATTDRAAYESKAQPASLEKLLLAPGTYSCPIYYFHVSRLISWYAAEQGIEIVFTGHEGCRDTLD
jgi:hypothetical protein